jgi:protoheme IX farnesyltransferase
MDALLPRKSSRPVAAGIVKPSEALLCGFVLFIIAALSAWVFSIAFFGITLLAVFCSVVYTVLKRKMALSIFISALVVGLLPIGVWITLQGQVGLTGLVAAALLIFWFLSHLTAACFAHADEYKLIERPTVLCVYGEKVASALLVAAICGILLTSLALFRLGGLGLLYLATVLVGGSLLLASGVKVASTRSLKDGLLAFRLSRVYALALFLAMMIDILW